MAAAGAPPLAGTRVLELGSTVAGPAAGRILADLGAEVIKVEPPEGDTFRTWGIASPDGTGWRFKAHNRNKRLVCLDLRQERDRAIAREIALRCDVVLENFRPGRLDAWGLGEAQLRRDKPDLIYASISGYGQDGPDAKRVCYGTIAEAVGGLRHVTGYPDLPPARISVNLGDELAALHAVIGILAALLARGRDGRGDRIDVSLVESCFSLMQGALAEYGATGSIVGRAHTNNAPGGLYPTLDGKWVVIVAVAVPIFRRLCVAMGRPELAADPRFDSSQARIRNAAEIDGIVEAWTRSRNAREVLATLDVHEVPVALVNTIADIAADPHMRARGAMVEVPARDGPPVVGLGLHPRLREHPGRIDHAAGALGEDTEAVLRELGIDAGSIAAG